MKKEYIAPLMDYIFLSCDDIIVTSLQKSEYAGEFMEVYWG